MARPLVITDGTVLTAAHLNTLQDGQVWRSPDSSQVVQPASASLVPLTLRSHASSSAGTLSLESKDTGGGTTARLYKEGTLDVFTGNAIFPSFRAFGSGSDTQPSFRVAGADVSMGVGGTTALDTQFARVTNSLGEAPFPQVNVRNLADANMPVQLNVNGAVRVSKATSEDSYQAAPLYATSFIDDNFTQANLGKPFVGIESENQFWKTNTASALTVVFRGMQNATVVGTTGVVAKGSVEGLSNYVRIDNADSSSEHTGMTTFLIYNGGTSAGRAWTLDLNLQGRQAVQHNLLSGVNMFVNNHYNGSPTASPSYAFAAQTLYNDGGGNIGAVQTYPVDVGFGVWGTSGTAKPGASNGFNIAFQAGQTAGNTGGWNISASKIGTGLEVNQWTANGIVVNARLSGSGSADQVGWRHRP
jgi:hypothetical protein